MEPARIIGPRNGEKICLEVKTPDRLDEWPDFPGMPRPKNEHEEAALVERLNASLEHALEGELGVHGLMGGNMPVVLTNREPEEVLGNLMRARDQAFENMMDPVMLGLGSIRTAVLRSRFRDHLLSTGEGTDGVPEVNWGSLRDLLDAVLPAAAERLIRAKGMERLLAAQLICLCRAPLPVPGGAFRLFAEGMHPVVDATFERASEVIKMHRRNRD